jgi:hypothetical protein
MRNAYRGTMLGIMIATGTAAMADQETLGEIVATIDGEPLEWRTLGPDAAGNSYNTGITTIAGMRDVSVMGFPPGSVTMRGVLQLTFMLLPNASDLFEQDVIFAPEGMSQMWTTIEGEDLITLDQFDASEPVGEVSGRISGRVCQRESMFADPDPDTCRQIEGTFTTRLPHGEL